MSTTKTRRRRPTYAYQDPAALAWAARLVRIASQRPEVAAGAPVGADSRAESRFESEAAPTTRDTT